MTPRTGVVVVHWRDWQRTNACLTSLKMNGYGNIQVQVVDNDADNRGFAGGANAGIRALLQDPEVAYVLVLNNDVRVEAGAIAAMVRAAQASGRDMVAPRVLTASGEAVDRLGITLGMTWLGFNKADNSRQEPFCPSGCAALYSRRLIEDISQDGQFFDEDFFMYGEDTDVGLRAQARGYRCVAAERAVVYHEGSASSRGTSLPLYLGHRNNAWYIAKNISLNYWYLWPAILAGQVASLALLTLRGEGKLIWKAKYDAAKGLPKMWRKRTVARALNGSSQFA